MTLACTFTDTNNPFGKGDGTSETDSTGETSPDYVPPPPGTGPPPGWDDTGDDDTPEPPPDAMIGEDACKALDFLFVIDASGSMSDEQAALIASFPDFIDGIQSYIPTVESYQVGVVVSGPYDGNPVACRSFGALVTATVGETNASDAVCGPYSDGYNYMTENDDLDVTFPCAAQVGTSTGLEAPFQAIISSMDPFLQSPGQCNEGFAREDTTLVVTIITDEDDQSGGLVDYWYDYLVWLKGTQDDIVVLSLILTKECSEYNAVRLEEFTNKFTYGHIGPICASGYGQFFYEALGVIQASCAPPIE